MTFDDGPLKGTENILKVLEKEQVVATMFMVGKHIVTYKSLYQKALRSPYITIANHTYSHAYGKYWAFYKNTSVLLKDVQRSDVLLSNDMRSTIPSLFHPLRLAGRNVFRLPRLLENDYAIKTARRHKEQISYDRLAKAGFFIYGWDAQWEYNRTTGKPLGSAQKIVSSLEEIYTNKLAKKPDKVILLMHDFMFRDAFNGEKNLQLLIKLLKQKGWKFARIETYI